MVLARIPVIKSIQLALYHEPWKIANIFIEKMKKRAIMVVEKCRYPLLNKKG